MAGVYPKPIILPQQTTPANPPANNLAIYPKSDGKFYQLDSAGVESLLGTEGPQGPPGSSLAIGPQAILVYTPATVDKTFVKADYPGISAIRVRCVGGGGGSGGGASGTGGIAIGQAGSGGAYAESLFTDLTDLPATVTVSPGAGGNGGTSGNNNGADGEESYFMSTGAFKVQAQPGLGGVGGPNSGTVPRSIGGAQAGAINNENTHGQITIKGGSAQAANALATSRGHGGNGGDSVLGFGGRGGIIGSAGTASGNDGQNYGGGGGGGVSGASSSAVAGADGGDGVVIVEVYCIDVNVSVMQAENGDYLILE